VISNLAVFPGKVMPKTRRRPRKVSALRWRQLEWLGCRLCLLSAKGTRRNPDSAMPGLLHDVSKQRVARLMQKAI
jgi:hypothetical protein